jgi:hypothetical protein
MVAYRLQIEAKKQQLWLPCPGCFMNYCRETVKMGVPPGNRPAVSRDWTRGVPERYVAGCDTRGRTEGLLYPRSQQVIHETSGAVIQRLFPKQFPNTLSSEGKSGAAGDQHLGGSGGP